MPQETRSVFDGVTTPGKPCDAHNALWRVRLVGTDREEEGTRMREMVTVEVRPEVWVRMTRAEAEKRGYLTGPQATKKATPTRKKKAATDG